MVFLCAGPQGWKCWLWHDIFRLYAIQSTTNHLEWFWKAKSAWSWNTCDTCIHLINIWMDKQQRHLSFYLNTVFIYIALCRFKRLPFQDLIFSHIELGSTAGSNTSCLRPDMFVSTWSKKIHHTFHSWTQARTSCAAHFEAQTRSRFSNFSIFMEWTRDSIGFGRQPDPSFVRQASHPEQWELLSQEIDIALARAEAESCESICFCRDHLLHSLKSSLSSHFSKVCGAK